MDPLRRAALLWAIDEQPAEVLPGVATDLLVQGTDSPALRELAGAPADDFWQVKALFEQTLRELGIEVPGDDQAALWAVAQDIAQEIVEGRRAPADGAHWIWKHLSDRIIREGDLRVFVALASEWDDHPEDHARVNAGIVEAAVDLLTRSEPRRWVKIQARQGRSPAADSGTGEEIAPGDLPVSIDLAVALTKWSLEYEGTFASVPGTGGFESESAAELFVETGHELVVRMRDELGDTWWVEYMPEPIRPPGLRVRSAGA